MSPPLRLAVLISGSGRTLANFVDRIAAGTLPAQIACVICSKSGVPGIDVARRANLPVELVPRRNFPDDASFGDAIERALAPHSFDLAVLAGFIHHLPVSGRLRGRAINIHPALLPRFGGKGFYGERVHQAVLKAGDQESGCTVHWVDEQYDHGRIILQKRVPVLADDTAETLAHRVFEAECEAYPEALALLAKEWKR